MNKKSNPQPEEGETPNDDDITQAMETSKKNISRLKRLSENQLNQELRLDIEQQLSDVNDNFKDQIQSLRNQISRLIAKVETTSQLDEHQSHQTMELRMLYHRALDMIMKYGDTDWQLSTRSNLDYFEYEIRNIIQHIHEIETRVMGRELAETHYTFLREVYEQIHRLQRREVETRRDQIPEPETTRRLRTSGKTFRIILTALGMGITFATAAPLFFLGADPNASAIFLAGSGIGTILITVANLNWDN